MEEEYNINYIEPEEINNKEDIKVPEPPKKFSSKEGNELLSDEDIKDMNIKEKIITKSLGKEEFRKIEKFVKYRMDKEIFQSRFSIIKAYIVVGILLVLTTIAFIVFWFSSLEYYIKLTVSFFVIPLYIITVIVLIFRQLLFNDWGVIFGKIIVKVRSDYIVARFWLTQKRTVERICLMLPDGITFMHNGGIYIADPDSIYFNEFNQPCSNYIPNFPLPCKFDFLTTLSKGYEAYTNPEMDIIDNKVDVMYDSINLERMKNHDYVKKLHKDNSKEITKIIMLAFIVIGLAFVAIIIVVMVMQNKQPVQVNFVPNVTSAVASNIKQI